MVVTSLHIFPLLWEIYSEYSKQNTMVDDKPDSNNKLETLLEDIF